MGEPVKVTAEQLGVVAGEEYDGHLEYDVGNLSAFDPAPVEASRFLGDTGEEELQEVARAITQSLAARLFTLPSEPIQGGRLAELPDPTTVLPREKPIPKPKPLTKWQKFAQEKGIVKRKRSKLVFDEVEQDWKRRHGYNRANDDLDLPIIEASSRDQPGDDPFTRMEKERKERVKKNKKQQLDNVKTAVKEHGKGAVAPTLKLAAILPEKGADPTSVAGGVKRKRKDLKTEIKGASRLAGISTASMGKFDKRLQGEKEGERAPVSKRRNFLAVTDTTTEKAKIGSYVDKFLRERSDDLGDAKPAIAKFEAEAADRMAAGRGGKGGKRGGRGGMAGGRKGKGGKHEGHMFNRKDPSGRGGAGGNRGKRGKSSGGGKARKT